MVQQRQKNQLFWFLRTETLRNVKASFTPYQTAFVPSQNHSGSVFPFTFETVFTTKPFVPFLHLFTMQNKRYTYIGKIIIYSQLRSHVGGGGGRGAKKSVWKEQNVNLWKKSRDGLFKKSSCGDLLLLLTTRCSLSPPRKRAKYSRRKIFSVWPRTP